MSTNVPSKMSSANNGYIEDGLRVLYNNTTNVDNVDMGFRALHNNTTTDNVDDGHRVLYSNTTGSTNVADAIRGSKLEYELQQRYDGLSIEVSAEDKQKIREELAYDSVHQHLMFWTRRNFDKVITGHNCNALFLK